MAKMLSLPGLYTINKIACELSPATGSSVVVISVTGTASRRKREYRFDAVSISQKPEEAPKAIEYFLDTGKMLSGSKMSYYPTPYGYRQNLIIASLDKIRNQPCLVRYTFAGKNIGMLFYPHEISF